MTIMSIRDRVYFCVHLLNRKSFNGDTAQKMKFSIKDFVSKCDPIRRKLGPGGLWPKQRSFLIYQPTKINQKPIMMNLRFSNL